MTDDVLERLRAADPLAGQAPPAPTDAGAIAMRDQIMAMDRDVVDLDRRRQRRRRAVVAAVALAAAAATAAAILVSTRRPTQVSAVGCFTEAATAADTTVVSATGSNPVDPCRQLWEAGDMDPDVTSPDEVPPLVACVLESGAVGVFPTTSCDEVDVSGRRSPSPSSSVAPSPSSAPSPPPRSGATDDPGPTGPGPTVADPPEGLPMPDYQTSDETIRQALEQIRLDMADRCLTLEAATALAEEVLAVHGIEGWTIGPIWEDLHTDQTCAGFFPDAPEETIWWTPEEPADGQTPGPR